MNAATAATALRVLAENGWRIDDAAIRTGVATAAWPGRLETLAQPTDHEPGLVVDGAHNPHAAAALAAAVRELAAERSVHLILGFGAGKDAGSMVDILGPLATSIVTCQAPHPKALGPRTVAGIVRRRGFGASAKATPERALDTAIESAAPGGLLLATGSIFVAAAIREAWFARSGWPLPPCDGPPVSAPPRREYRPRQPAHR
jgi:dihydrofolate synthase/folylpolyglutamate synthase